MIRSPMGAVWIQLSKDMDGDEFTPPSLGEDDEGGIADTPTILQEQDEENEDVFQDTDDYGPLWNSIV